MNTHTDMNRFLPVMSIILFHQGGMRSEHQFNFAGTSINYRVPSPVLSSIIHVQTAVITCFGAFDAWACLLEKYTWFLWRSWMCCRPWLELLCHWTTTLILVTSVIWFSGMSIFSDRFLQIGTYLVTVDRSVATVGRVSIVLTPTTILNCVSLTTLESDKKNIKFKQTKYFSCVWVIFDCSALGIYLVIACILRPSSMLWDKACWLLCLLMRAKTLSWWASYSSRLG